MDCEGVLQKSTHLNPTIFSHQNLQIFTSFFQTSTNKFDSSPIFRLLIHHTMHKHQLLHSSDAKVLPFYDYNVLKHNSQSMNLSIYLFSKSGNHNHCFNYQYQFDERSPNSQTIQDYANHFELFIFKDLQGAENGRSFNLHFQRYHLICSFFTDFQGPESGRSFYPKFQRPLLNYPIVRLSRP